MKYDNFFVSEEPFFDHEMITLCTKMTDDINQMLIKGMFKTSLKVGYMIESNSQFRNLKKLRILLMVEHIVLIISIKEYKI